MALEQFEHLVLDTTRRKLVVPGIYIPEGEPWKVVRSLFDTTAAAMTTGFDWVQPTAIKTSAGAANSAFHFDPASYRDGTIGSASTVKAQIKFTWAENATPFGATLTFDLMNVASFAGAAGGTVSLTYGAAVAGTNIVWAAANLVAGAMLTQTVTFDLPIGWYAPRMTLDVNQAANAGAAMKAVLRVRQE